MNYKEARNLRFDCQQCNGVMTPVVMKNKDTELGFEIIEVVCQTCGYAEMNEETTETLLGL